MLELIAEGHTYDQILAIQPTLTYMDIFKAAREALDIAEEATSGYTKRLAQIRRSHSRAYEKWTTEEEDRLVQLFRSNRTVEDIAPLLQLQPSAIRSLMMRLGLIERQNGLD